jgi:hypothetical protein
MRCRQAIGVLWLAWQFIGPARLLAQSGGPAISLTVTAGRPLEVVIEQRTTIKKVGQPVVGTLVEPLYAYDRVVVPAGTRVLGHVAAFVGASKAARARAILSGDLTPLRHVVLQFDTLLLDDGDRVNIRTAVKSEIPHLKRTSTPAPAEAREESGDTGIVHRAEHEAANRLKQAIGSAKQQERDILAEITQPGRTHRLKEALVERLPYHPIAISAGTGYHAELLAPLDFGSVDSSEIASPDLRPSPSSILNVRLITALDSSKTPRGTEVRAVLTEPVFSDDHQLLLPEGTTVEGEVTLATHARWFHRNGHLRFIFERVQVPTRDAIPLMASLQSVQASGDDQLTLDDEGGATVSNSKTRFIAPTLAVLALRGNLDHHEHPDPDGDGHMIQDNNPGATTVGGFFGLGLLGIPLSHMAPPIGLTLSIMGASKTVYRNVVAKGREVQFPADTVMQLQLAPGPSAAQR